MRTESLGFIGVGIMGEGMVSKILETGRKVFITKHSNSEPIERLKIKGATELENIDILAKRCELVILCLPNSTVVKKIIEKLSYNLATDSLIIDCTTNNFKSVIELESLTKNKNLRYVEAPLTGGRDQAVAGKLGAMIGGSYKNYKITKKILNPCCERVERIGKVGMGAKAKLISNFLALGTASLTIESLRAAREMGVDWKKFYHLSSLGAGSSKALDRIAQKAIKDDYDSYAFTIDNTIKDFLYMLELFERDERISKIIKPILDNYKKNKVSSSGKSFISKILSNNFQEN